MRELLKTDLTVVGAHSTRPDAPEGEMRVLKMDQRIVDTASSERDISQYPILKLMV